MPTRGNKDPNGRALRGRRAHTTFASSVDPAAQIWSNYNVRSGVAGAETPEQPAVQNCLYDRFEALYKKSSIKPSLVIVPARFKSGTLYSEIPTANGDFTVTRATTPTANRSTRVNANGFIELVNDNVPRLDYYTSGGTAGCPALLVEPSAQNVVVQSQNWLASGWRSDVSGNVTTVSATTGTLDPLGTNTANAISPTAASGTHNKVSNDGNLSFTSGTIYTFSAFFKQGTGSAGRYVQLTSPIVTFTQAFYANFDLQLGTIAATGSVSADSNRAASIQNFGNGWYRCRITATCNVTTTSVGLVANLITASGDTRSPSFSGTTTDILYGWGAQLETGSVATSYIPTTTAAVTRNADVISVTGAVSGSIGQASGTIYAEVDLRNTSSGKRVFLLSDGTSQNEIRVTSSAINAGDLQFAVRLAGTLIVNAFSPTNVYSNGVFKIAAVYKSADYALYVNGLQVLTSNAAGNIPACNRVDIGSQLGTSNFLNDRIRSAALYTTRLTNEQLAFITQP